MKRSIILNPEFDNSPLIQDFRARYDPLYMAIAPHISLVFPFESDLPMEDLEKHLKQQLQGITPFTIKLKGVTGDRASGFLFLGVKQGNDEIITLHDRLYQGPLLPYLYREAHYIPHITIGQTLDKELFDQALIDSIDLIESFNCLITEVVVETISDSDKSFIACRYSLEN